LQPGTHHPGLDQAYDMVDPSTSWLHITTT
jgi:hypothetical protein